MSETAESRASERFSPWREPGDVKARDCRCSPPPGLPVGNGGREMVLAAEGGRKGRKTGAWRAAIAMKKGECQNKRTDPERYFLLLNS